jgi:hypothetical protein
LDEDSMAYDPMTFFTENDWTFWWEIKSPSKVVLNIFFHSARSQEKSFSTVLGVLN